MYNIAMNIEQIDNMLVAHKDINKDVYEGHYLEQYRIYLHIFNNTSDRRQKSNEFFLGLNAAIIGIIGYVESKALPHASLIFMLIPLVGISICYSWHRMILSYKQLNRAKFKVIHTVERKLPLSLFETEWDLLGKGKDPHKYLPLSQTEKNIPLMFIVLYAVIFLASLPWDDIMMLPTR